jgi:hypothetical protein
MKNNRASNLGSSLQLELDFHTLEIPESNSKPEAKIISFPEFEDRRRQAVIDAVIKNAKSFAPDYWARQK